MSDAGGAGDGSGLTEVEVGLLGEIEEYVLECMEEADMVPSLGVVSRRFAKRVAARSSRRLVDLIKAAPDRFSVTVSSKGATMIIALGSRVMTSELPKLGGAE